MNRTRPFLMIMFGAVLMAQPARRVFREPDAAFRAKVRELAFPADVLTKPGVELALILHFKPSFHPEEEILLAVERGGAGQIVYRAAAVESQRVFESLEGRPLIGPEAAAKRLQVRTLSIALPEATVRDWLSRFWRAVSTSAAERDNKILSGEAQLDGTLYSCDYREEASHLSISFPGSELGNAASDDSELIKWMNDFRLMVQRMTAMQK